MKNVLIRVDLCELLSKKNLKIFFARYIQCAAGQAAICTTTTTDSRTVYIVFKYSNRYVIQKPIGEF